MTESSVFVRRMARTRPHRPRSSYSDGSPDAVVRALESGQLAGYAGDVWFPQPPPQDHPWRSMPHHGMTPHTSGTSLWAQARYRPDGKGAQHRHSWAERGGSAPGLQGRSLARTTATSDKNTSTQASVRRRPPTGLHQTEASRALLQTPWANCRSYSTVSNRPSDTAMNPSSSRVHCSHPLKRTA